MVEAENLSCPYCGIDEAEGGCILKTVHKRKDGERTSCRCENLTKRGK
ncbi:MAG: hypothetical protein ACLFVP_01200 [Candidatus Bathyarchaeia archaeon]